MTGVRLILRMAVLVSVSALAACSSPTPKLYTIAPVDGPARTGGPGVILLQQIGVARYLERSQIVLSSENYRLNVLPNDWWGEPVAAMLSRVLIDELSQRLPRSTVLGENGSVTSTADATVELSVRRLDQDTTGSLVLQAQAAVSFKGRPEPVLRSYRVVVVPGGPGVEAGVAAISAAVGQLADGLASVLLRGSLGPMTPFAQRGPPTQEELKECPGCGLFHVIPPLRAWHERAVHPLPDHFTPCRLPFAGLQYRAHRGRAGHADHHVRDDAHERADSWHHASGWSVFGTSGVGSSWHGRARGGRRLRHRGRTVWQAHRHALCFDPNAGGDTAPATCGACFASLSNCAPGR